MSSLYLPEQSPDLPNGVRISLTRAKHDDGIHYTTVANELYRVISNDAEAHSVVYDGKGFKKVLDAFKRNKIQAYFLIVERENCLPAYAGGAIQFPTVVTEWNGQDFVHYPATYSEDTWVDRGISDQVRKLTQGSVFPSGVGLGTLNTNGRIKLSAAGSSEDLPFGMISKARISENATDNARQFAILKKLRATFDLEKSAVLQFDSACVAVKGRNAKVETYGFGCQNGNNGLVGLLENVFLTSWSNMDGTQRIVGTYTEAISTTTGETIVRSQFMSNGNLPSPETTKKIVASMISSAQTEVLNRGWTEGNDNSPREGALPIIRVHALEQRIVNALKEIGGVARRFGAHTMVPAIVNYKNIVDINLPNAKPLNVIRYSHVSRPKIQGHEYSASTNAIGVLAS